jgi:hypothetical protein
MSRDNGTIDFEVSARRLWHFWPRFYVLFAFRVATGRVPDPLVCWVCRGFEINVEHVK